LETATAIVDISIVEVSVPVAPDAASSMSGNSTSAKSRSINTTAAISSSCATPGVASCGDGAAAGASRDASSSGAGSSTRDLSRPSMRPIAVSSVAVSLARLLNAYSCRKMRPRSLPIRAARMLS
jgi:hypothetical protein